MDDASLIRSLCRWFDAAARDLPWRDRPPGERDPYHVLVSELMLQQTQVARVEPRFRQFLQRFPTPAHLAAADEQQVLAIWSGLGYYRRARHLQAAARAITEDHGGRFPRDFEQILALPGVGRYTAGMIASLAFGLAEPAVDGNVQRVLMRLSAQDADPQSGRTRAWAWQRAQELIATTRPAGADARRRAPAGASPGKANEALIELGATVCTPRAPACERCPLAHSCAARSQGLSGQIPRARRRADRRILYCAAALIDDPSGRLLVEQRGDGGLWAGLWQAPTLEAGDSPPRPADLAEHLRVPALRRAGGFTFLTTHREVRFAIYRARRPAGARLAIGGRRWMRPSEVERLPLASPQRRILLDPEPAGA